MTQNEAFPFVEACITFVLLVASCYLGYTLGGSDIEYKQKLGSVIIQQWGDEDDLYLLINPFTGGFYSDHETLEDAVLHAVQLYEHGQINKIIFDLNRDGVPDETYFEKALQN